MGDAVMRDHEHLLPEDVAAESDAWYAHQDAAAQRADESKARDDEWQQPLLRLWLEGTKVSAEAINLRIKQAG
jgi:hypothetical protein